MRIKRIMKRDDIKKDLAQKKINSQMPELDKQKLTDVNIINEADFDDLIVQLQKLLVLISESEKKSVKKIIEID